MKELFSLRTVRKKVLMLSKLAGIALIFLTFSLLACQSAKTPPS